MPPLLRPFPDALAGLGVLPRRTPTSVLGPPTAVGGPRTVGGETDRQDPSGQKIAR